MSILKGFLTLAGIVRGRKEASKVDSEEATAARLRRFDARIADLANNSSDGRGSGPLVPATTVSRVAETVTVVPRRQVPVRHDEPSRSWLGGLPMMPDDVEWPRGVNPEKEHDGSRPLHFVAQIACADLPTALWGGLGPREGWLLFFLDNNSSTIDTTEQHRILHVPALGPERQPPADTGPVHDGEYTGSQFGAYMPQADVPPVWRRWPVDLVVFPNQLHRNEQRSFATPPGFAATLWAGQPVGEDGERAPAIDPFSWRCLHWGWRQLRDTAAAKPELHRNEQGLRDRLVEQGPVDALVTVLDAREAELDAGSMGTLLAADPATLTDAERERLPGIRQRRQERMDVRERVVALVERYPDHAGMLAFLDGEWRRRAAWRATTLDRLAAVDAEIAATDPDNPLPPEKWATIKALLEADRFTGWFPGWTPSAQALSVQLEERTETSWDLIGTRIGRTVQEVAADYYVDPKRRPLLPDSAIAVLEPWWRTLYGNRPHRIGGFHDGVQSDAVEGPTDRLLLMQLATDDPMQWCWGDAGAIYWYMPTDALAAGAWNRAECDIECH